MAETQLPAHAKELSHRLVSLVVAGLYGWVVYRTARGMGEPGTPDGPLLALILLAALNSLTALARQLQWQYVLSAAAITAGFGSLASLATLNSGIPFGPLVFGPAAGETLAGKLPWTMPLLWLVVVFNSRGVGRLILRPWRKIKTYGFWLIGLTVGLSVLFDLGMDPYLARVNHYWLWQPTRFSVTWQGAPLVNCLGWLAVTLFILAFATPLLIKKQPGQKNLPDYHPLLMWVGAMGLFALATGRHGLWGAVALDAVVVLAALVPAIRGARW
jgi:uncharacterized membrane protein